MLCRVGPLVLVLMLMLLLSVQEGIREGQLAFAEEAPNDAVESPADAAATSDGDGGPAPSPDEEDSTAGEGEEASSDEATTEDGAAGEAAAEASEDVSEEGAEAAEAAEPTQDEAPGAEAHAEWLPVIARSVVQVVVRDRNDEVRRVGSGFAVADDLILTAAHVVDDESRIVAIPLVTGAELVARVAVSDESADGALLRVSGLGLPPVTFAREGFASGRRVTSMGAWSQEDGAGLTVSMEDDRAVAFARGAVGQLEPIRSRDVELELIEHNAMIPAAGYGGPLVNECGQVAGMNRGTPGVSRTRLRRGLAPEGVVVATGAAGIVAVFGDTEVTLAVGEEVCPDALETARDEALQAETEAATERDRADRNEDDLVDARERVEESASQLEGVQAELEEARRRLEDLEREAERRGEAADTDASDEDAAALQDALNAQRALIVRLETTRVELEEEKRKRELQLTVTIVSAVAAVMLVVAGAIVLYRRRLQQVALAQAAQAAQARARAPADAGVGRARTSAARYVLSGNTSDGQAVSLTVFSDQLEAGVVVGRHPQRAGLVIADRTLSREHARLSSSTAVTGGSPRMSVRDLGTTNGTSVNGRRLSRGEEAVVADGDTVEFGGVVLQVRRGVG